MGKVDGVLPLSGSAPQNSKSDSPQSPPSSASISSSSTNTEESASTSKRASISLRQISDRCVNCDVEFGGNSALEMDAIAAVRELGFAVESITISELLPRTPELIFINVTTCEGNVYCVELTVRGWRVASTRHDSMNGDFRQLSMYTRYFDTIYQLLDFLSPEYRNRFCASVASRLETLAANMVDGEGAEAASQNGVEHLSERREQPVKSEVLTNGKA